MKQKELTKEEILTYLTEMQDVIKISVVGKRAGIGRRLLDIINQTPDGHGRLPTLADHHLPLLRAEIDRIKGR